MKEQFQNSTPKFQPYFPLQINGHLFVDPLLNQLEKTIIALAQLMRLQIAYARSEGEQQKILKNFTSSYFAAATGKHRDHIRRVINSMQKNEAVQKYLTIFILPKVEFNTEQIFRFTFKDQLPDQLNERRVKNEADETELDKKLTWYNETLLQNYINSIKLLSGETARSLIQLVRCEPTELMKGLVYLKEQMKRKEISNPKGYLISSFDLNGNFKYVIKPAEYLTSDSDYKISNEFEFEVDKEQLLLYIKHLKNDRDGSKFNFFFRENGTKAYVESITEAGRKRNIKNHLKRAGINYKIVTKNSFENV